MPSLRRIAPLAAAVAVAFSGGPGCATPHPIPQWNYAAMMNPHDVRKAEEFLRIRGMVAIYRAEPAKGVAGPYASSVQRVLLDHMIRERPEYASPLEEVRFETPEALNAEERIERSRTPRAGHEVWLGNHIVGEWARVDCAVHIRAGLDGTLVADISVKPMTAPPPAGVKDADPIAVTATWTANTRWDRGPRMIVIPATERQEPRVIVIFLQPDHL